MTLHYYFAWRFLRIFIGLLAVFLLMSMLIDVAEHLRRLSSTPATLSQVLRLVLLNAPEGIYTILPLIMILATVALFLGLARTSELVVTRAAGRSALRSLVSPVIVAFAIGVIGVAMVNPIVAATSKRYAALLESYQSGGADVLSLSAEGLWLRQGGAEGQTVIRAARSNPQATELYDVTMIAYAPDGGPEKRIEAARARLIAGAWELHDARIWPLARGTNPEARTERRESFEVPSSLTEARIRDTFGEPSAIPVWDMPTYIGLLTEAGFSARRHAVWFQMELAKPLFLVAMVLIAAAFTMRHVRFGKTGIAVLSAIMLGFALYYVRNFVQILGENGQIPVALAAWAPPVASVLLALGLLLHMEDG
ncbi:permease, YjgP/YjgQ family protein [Pseudooceanicola batsensis HTCC2597]|uniref:Permease, YjgP/YjgQ family protein n=1 Tax=Pseudooceanicola batsensis (strain ATCC BAA-863 / DSM 15984 / KCTC 12145 / HTCC2597) TaxID=252305 RepID=A3TXB3_PSEBH|nr:LPS export ABC transporter permease LptG [Pseudooceanicola batsensis]EAQ03473.1 permease, YjgP/YjgQ family protein [Pseudooceanicola batsensis HTCC2597]